MILRTLYRGSVVFGRLAFSMSKSGPEPPILSVPQPRARAPRKARRAAPAAFEVGKGEDPRVALGRAVHRHRIAVGISQEDLADQVGLDRTYISGIERGLRNPTFLVLLRLAEALKVPVRRLVELKDAD